MEGSAGDIAYFGWLPCCLEISPNKGNKPIVLHLDVATGWKALLPRGSLNSSTLVQQNFYVPECVHLVNEPIKSAMMNYSTLQNFEQKEPKPMKKDSTTKISRSKLFQIVQLFYSPITPT